MFRRLLIVLAALAVAGGSLPAQAAPVSGSATLDIVFEPLREGSGPGAKIDKIRVKFELDLVLTLSVSGVDITSVSVFTFKGLEYQSFIATGTIGALAFRSQFVFAPNIVEIEEFRDDLGLPVYCVNFADPPGPPPTLPGLFPCPPDPLAVPMGHALWWLLHGADGIFNLIGLVPLHPAWANLILANIFEAFDQLDAPLSFRKKVVDLTLSIAGLTIGLRGMFANIGSTTTPAWRTGIVASVEGQTVSGITIRGETWIGAVQGLECFGECKPIERIFGAKVIRDFVITEEKLFIRNLKIAGVTFDARLEFSFRPSVGLAFMQLTQSFTLAPFRLSITNTINVGPLGPNDLTILSDVVVTSLRIGEMSTTAVFYIWPSVTGAFNIFFSELITTFDPPGMKVTSHIKFCIDENWCGFAFAGGIIIGTPTGVFVHNLALAAAVGDLTIDILISLNDVLTGFQRAHVDVALKLGGVKVKSGTVLGPDQLIAQAFTIETNF